MNDYEKAKQECWGYLCDNHRTLGETTKKCFDVAFERAYQLGKEHAQPAYGLANKRLQVAAMAMQGILANGQSNSAGFFAEKAVRFANALLTELNKENNDTDSNK